MRVRTRAIAMTAFILAFSMMSVPGLIGSQMGLGVAQGQTSSLYPVVVTLDTGEKIFIATHNSILADGNWISLSGGTSIALPLVTLIYDGLSTASYPGVTIDSTFDQGQTIYPLVNHRVYSTAQSITAMFWGASALAGADVDFKLISISSIAEAREIFTDAFQGDISNLRGRLTGALITTPVTLDGSGDKMITIDPKPVGNYLLLVTKEETAPYKLYIYSATIIEVLEQTLYVTCPSSVEQGDPLNINTGLTGTYIHGAILIRETAYSAKIKLKTLGTVLSTELYLNEVPMADGAFVIDTKTLSYDDAVLLLNQLNTAFGSNQFAYGISLVTGSMSISTSSLTTGNYILLVGVYNALSSKIVGIAQKTVTIKTPYVPTPAPTINKLPVANAGPDQKAWVNRTVNFDGSKSTDPDGYIQSWSWNFGDGKTASGKTVSHTYQEPGNYTVTLTVRDNRYGEDSDTCTAKISEPVEPVTDELEELIPGGETDYLVNATAEANTTVTLNTTDPVTVTIIKYEDNPHPDDPLPATALPNYVDVEVSDPDAIVWPIYVEMFYTDEEAKELDESSLGIYYWKNDAWHRCSNTGVDTDANVVWAYMTADEASGSPILIAGMPAIAPPPLPPILSNLTITPTEIELGEEVIVSFVIENTDSQNYTYVPFVQIGPTTIMEGVELSAYESVTVFYKVIPDKVGFYEVKIDDLTGNFTVKAPPLKPAEFVASDLTITPEEVGIWEEVKIKFTVTNIGELPGDYAFTLGIEGPVIVVSREINGSLEAGESETASYVMGTNIPGIYNVEVNGLKGSFTMKELKPAEFEIKSLSISPDEVEPGASVTVSAKITNIGEETGGIIIELKLDGTVVDIKTVTLNGGDSETVTFTTSSEEEGSHSVEIDGLSGSFTVEAPPPTDNLLIWIAIIIVSVAIALYIIWKRTDWIDQLRASPK